MAGDLSRLTEREREVLRLLSRGHDGKSTAHALGISLNSVNERLRDARRKLGVSSSREAARMLAAHEQGTDIFLGDEEIGVAAASASPPDVGGPQRHRMALTRPKWPVVGGAVLLLLIGLLLVDALSPDKPRALPVLSSGDGQASIITLPVPQVVSTTPASGATIAFGAFELSVTFDAPMHPNSYSFVRTSGESYPNCESKPSQSVDGRTFRLRCVARPDRQYEVWFNRPPYMNFKSKDGVPARPARLNFSAGTVKRPV